MAADDLRVLNDRYEIHRRLARGGMAQVYLARDRSLDRPVAVKELAAEFATDPSFVERFRREAQAAANLAHPNVVGVYDWGSQDSTYFIVMEYVDGPSLSRVLRAEGPLHSRRAAEIASEVAAGLGFAHSRGVVHRDVKPGNVLLTRSGQAKVTDFGIARALSSPDEDLTQAGSVMGTATYFSPEQAQGLPVDPRSDLYSLGVVLYELVTGRTPFTGETPLAIAYKHVQDTPEPPSVYMSDIPEGLEAIIMKLLSKQPDDRYSSAEELRADLRRFLAGEPTLAERQLIAAGAAALDGPATTVQAPTELIGAVPPPVVPGPDATAEDEPSNQSKTWVFIALLVLLLGLLAGLLFWFARSLDDGGMVAVPSVMGLTVDEAAAALEEVGLTHRVEERPSDQMEAGRIVDQEPRRGVEVKSGSEVVLIVSTGRDLVKVPLVYLMTQGEAERALAAEGFEVVVTEEESDEGRPGYVARQSPEGNTEAPRGSRVEIFVTVESGTVIVPKVVGRPLGQAETALQQAGLRFTSSEASSADVPTGSVISADPAEGTSVKRNSEVALVVSTGAEQVPVPNVVGESENEAKTQLGAKGFSYDIERTTLEPGDSGVGKVVSQEPRGGRSADKGSTVKLEIGVARTTTTTTAVTTTSTASTTTTSTTTPP